MGSDTTKRQRKPRSERGKRLRQLNRYFASAHESLTNSVYEVAPTLNALDAERIIDLLAKNREQYTGPANSELFERWTVEQVQRLARITVHIKGIIPSLTETAASVPGTYSDESARCAHCVLKRVDRFSGDPDDLDCVWEWANAQVISEVLNSQAFQEWYVAHQRAVYRGLWDGLTGCADLGLGQADETGRNEVVDNLARDCWRWVAEHAEEFLKPGAPIVVRLRELAKRTAKLWKIERLRERSERNLLRRVGRLAVKLAHDIDDPRPKNRPIVLGPGDFSAYDPPEVKTPLSSWDVPLEHQKVA